MSRTTRLITLTTLLTLLLTLVPATGSSARSRVDLCDRKPEHPSCQTSAGFSCLAYEQENPGSFKVHSWQPEPSDTMTYELTTIRSLCVDLTNRGPGDLTITIEDVPAGARGLTAIVKDSHPGDHCTAPLYLGLKKAKGSVTGTLSGVPIAADDECGNRWSDGDDALAFMVSYAGRPSSAPIHLSVAFD